MKSENMSEMSGIKEETRKANEITFAGLRNRAFESIDALFTKLRLNERFDALVGQYEAKLGTIPTKEEFLALIPEQKEITKEQVRDKLEDFTVEDDKLRISAIAHLEERLQELSKNKGTQIFGGGLSRGVADGLYAPISTISAGIVVYNEVVNGDVQTFTLLHTPVAGTLRVYARGQRILPTTDFTLVGAIITTTDTFTIGDLYADYTYV
jgi:hypothetical protein